MRWSRFALRLEGVNDGPGIQSPSAFFAETSEVRQEIR
ncbi:hypothetical protein ABIB48_003032 [Arthrobacter sp. UYCu511]